MSAPETLDAEELARTNERLREQQRAVSNVLRAVARSEGLQPVLDEIVESATRLCAGDNGRLWLVKDGVLHAAAQYGSPETYEYDVQHPHTVDRTSLAGRVALTHAPVHIPDILADPEYTYPGPRPYRAMLGVPVLIENDLIGVVAVVRIPPEPFADGHIELVRTFADQAAIAIANARLIDAVERQRTELSRFVSPQVAELLSNEQGEHLLAGHRAYISCLFCDLRGFTAFAETAAPEELLELLREYHAAIGELIPVYDGTLEHFAGDGLMLFFNDPVPVEDHALKAIRMALAAQARFDQLADTWRKRGSDVGLGIGIAAGYATLGRIGFEGRYDYGALGPVTNLASRLSTHAEPGQILISQRVFAEVEDVVDAEPVGEIELKGFGRPVVAYDIRGLH
ncbi:MAG TPA: adenylate/guanylate cyclase domain-containing protein [Gaiellaceae bacterium]|nr:adenylate/guanylate cyclase domain-containing protein [Gaiellaceae bacterium]